MDTIATTTTNADVLPKRQLSFSVAMKQHAIAWIRGPGLGNIPPAVVHFRALNWEVSAEILGKWWRQRDTINAISSDTSDTSDTMLPRSPRWGLLSAPQELALAAVIRRRARKVRVSAKWIGLAVRQMYPGTTSPSFSVSKTWLYGFAQRHGLALVGTTVVAAVDEPHRRGSSVKKSKAKTSKSARTMSLHDVLYEEKLVAATIVA